MSRLASGVLQWCDGDASAIELQHMSNELDDMAALSQEAHPMVHRLASIGNGYHAHGGLRSLLQNLGLLNLITTVDQPNYVTEMILPSTWFGLLHREHPRHFRSCLGADCANIREFWTSCITSENRRIWASRHAHLAGKTVAELVTTIPCTIHSDAGPATKRKSANIVSVSSMLGNDCENTSKFVVPACVKEQSRGDVPSWRR